MNKYLIILLFLISAFPANGQEDSLALKEADMMLNVADTISQIKYIDNYILWANNAGRTYRLMNDANIILNRYNRRVSSKFSSKVQQRLNVIEDFWWKRTYWLREWAGSVGRYDLEDRWQEIDYYYRSKYPSLTKEELISFAECHEIVPANAKEQALADSFHNYCVEYTKFKTTINYKFSESRRESFLLSAVNLQKAMADRLGKEHILYAVATCQVAMVHTLLRNNEKAVRLYGDAANVFQRKKDFLAMRLALYSASHIYHELAVHQANIKEDSKAAASIKDKEYALITSKMGKDALIVQIIADERQAMGTKRLTSWERERAENAWEVERKKKDHNADVFAEGVRLAKAKKYDAAIQTFMRCDTLDQIDMNRWWGFGYHDFRRQYTRQWICWCYIMNGQADKALEYRKKAETIPSHRDLIDLYYNTDAVIGLPPIDRSKTYEIDYYVNVEEKRGSVSVEHTRNVRQKYLQMVGTTFGTNSLEYARILAHLSTIITGSAEEGLDSLNRAHSIFNAHLGQNDFVDVYMLEKRAHRLRSLGYTYEAIKSLEQALNIYSLKYGIHSLLYHRIVDEIINFYEDSNYEDTNMKLNLARWQMQSYEYNPSLTLYDRLELLEGAAYNFRNQSDSIGGMHPWEKAAQLLGDAVNLCRQNFVEKRYTILPERPSENDSLGTKAMLYSSYCRARTLQAFTNYVVQRLNKQPISAIDSLKANITDIDNVLAIMKPKSSIYRSDFYERPLKQKKTALYYLALLQRYSQLHSDVLVTIDQVLEISRQLLSLSKFNATDTIPYLNIKARSYVALGQKDSADNLWSHTLDSIRRYESHPEKASYDYKEKVEKNDNAFRNYAHILQSIGKPQQAAEYMTYYLDRVTPRILNGLIVENALNREKYWKEKGTLFERELPLFAYHNGNPSIIGQLYDAVLLSKGLLLNTDMEIRRMLMENGDSTLISSYTQWLADQQVLAQQLRRSVQERTINTDSLSLRLRARQQQIFSTTSRKNQKDIVQNLHTSWQAIQQQLQPNDLAIEFLTVPVNRDSLLYVALTLRHDYTAPRMTSLCLQKEIQQIPSDLVYSTDTLYRLLWKPLEAELDNAHRVYFAPAGQLHQIGIEYLHGIQSERFIRLSSTRELVRPHLSPKIEAALYGGILYELTDQQRRQMTSQPSKSSLHLMRDVAIKRDLRGAEQEIPILPGSLHEVQSISHILKQHHAKAITVSGLEGTEASFKALSEQKKTLIHLSTHGFYLPQSSSRQETGSEGILLQGSEGAQTFEEQTLKRSGLLMTGAADFIYGQIDTNNKEDGILTAEEISQMNLQGLDLVVLSACETALGDITGDGVFGLQRGFKKAGAQSILMSLWKVDDEATCLLMTEFYKNWIGEGKTKHDALELAKQAVRSHKEKGWDKPEYWAAFILLDALD